MPVITSFSPRPFPLWQNALTLLLSPYSSTVIIVTPVVFIPWSSACSEKRKIFPAILSFPNFLSNVEDLL